MSSSSTSTSPPPPPPSSLYARTAAAVSGLLGPWLFMCLSLTYVPRAARTLLTQQQRPSPSPSSSSSFRRWWVRFTDVWFTLFWADGGRGMRAAAEPNVLPLLMGDGDGGVSGVVLELGAGAGLWVDVWASAPLRPRIERVYGVEPNADAHPALRRAVRRAGLDDDDDDFYEIVPVGIGEDLGGKDKSKSKSKKWDGGRRRLDKGSVDCVVSILTLCSVPDPEAAVRELYAYLRDGGRFYVYEHVRSEHSWYMRLYQRFLNIFWPHLIGGCSLCRTTEKTIREAGPWSRIEVGQPPAEQWHHCLPHIRGVFTK
ncbi:S-adenosyl-L-methionine-dependent methyltransferase [Biscogniauxia mediterranea]|nr:S-adenosyl-L-methionine-dependent methyltransferase [Biscogniauxia mediterranea]